MMRLAALVIALQWPLEIDRWFGADKLKHFLMSALVQSSTYSTARATGLRSSASQVGGAAAVMSVGLWKEFHDRRHQKPFSVEDLTWEAAGAVAVASLLNGAREA